MSFHACLCVSTRWTWRDAESHRNHSDQPVHWERYSAAHPLPRVLATFHHLSSLWQGKTLSLTHRNAPVGQWISNAHNKRFRMVPFSDYILRKMTALHLCGLFRLRRLECSWVCYCCGEMLFIMVPSDYGQVAVVSNRGSRFAQPAWWAVFVRCVFTQTVLTFCFADTGKSCRDPQSKWLRALGELIYNEDNYVNMPKCIQNTFQTNRVKIKWIICLKWACNK